VDETQEFPLSVFKEMGKLGLMGVLVPEKYGGAGLSYFEYVAVIQEISKVCGSIGLSLAAHNSLCTGHLLAFANEEQNKNTFPNWQQLNGSARGVLRKQIRVAMREI
jgi:alkylation response protein AidB-like acyl-CoA dehydrogenase